MLHRIYDYFMSNSHDQENEDTEKSEFTTQKEILDEVKKDCGNDEDCKNQVKGICSQMSNLYAQYRTTGEPQEEVFLKGSSKQIYNVMKQERDQQIKLAKEGKDYEHLGFASVPYDVKNVELKELTKEAKCKELLDQNHVLVTIPISENKNHQMYFGKKNDDKCILVDANAPTGKVEGDCDAFYGLFADKFKKMEDRFGTEKKVKFAMSQAPIHK